MSCSKFKKGHIPWNKGIKGSIPVNKTSFKKGNVPWNKGLTKKDHPAILEASRRWKNYNATRNQWGENNPAWRGGKSYEFYPSGWTRDFREKIRHRDNHKCQRCGITEKRLGRKLSVHHKDKNKNNLLPNNLISLCPKCHGSFHRKSNGI